MKYKLLAIDMDGTLLNSNNEVSLRTREAINEAKKRGVNVVIATGRILESASFYSKKLDLKNPILACNGALIVDEKLNIIYKNPMEVDKVKSIAQLSKDMGVYYHFYDEKKLYSPIRIEEIIKFYNEGNGDKTVDMEVFTDIDRLTKERNINIYKFLFIDNNIDKLKILRNEINRLENIGTSSSWPNNIEAMAANVSKGQGLDKLCKIMNIEAEEVIAIGDSENDLSMFKFAGLSVAMGNGEKIAKDNAAYITDTNNKDGVAKVIEKFIL